MYLWLSLICFVLIFIALRLRKDSTTITISDHHGVESGDVVCVDGHKYRVVGSSASVLTVAALRESARKKK